MVFLISQRKEADMAKNMRVVSIVSFFALLGLGIFVSVFILISPYRFVVSRLIIILAIILYSVLLTIAFMLGRRKGK